MIYLELDNPKIGLQKQTIYLMNPLDKRDWMQHVSASYLLKQCDSLRIMISRIGIRNWDLLANEIVEEDLIVCLRLNISAIFCF